MPMSNDDVRAIKNRLSAAAVRVHGDRLGLRLIDEIAFLSQSSLALSYSQHPQRTGRSDSNFKLYMTNNICTYNLNFE
jgi:hypothetical protein